MAAVSVSAVTGIIALIQQAVNIPNSSLLYVPAILLTAIYFGTGPSLLASAVAVLEFDFFLLAPRFTLNIKRLEDVLALAVFCSVALLTSRLAVHVRDRAEAAQRRARESRTLYELGQTLMFPGGTDEVLNRIAAQVTEYFEVQACGIFVPEATGTMRLAAQAGKPIPQPRAGSSTAGYVFRENTEVEYSAEADPSHRTHYLPLRAPDRVVGVMEVGYISPSVMAAEELGLLTSFAAQAAQVIARSQAEEERKRLATLEEANNLKSSLLSAVSHDLRTPLSSIKASATSLLLRHSWTEAERRELLEGITSESDRLNRLVGNLLDISRIEAGALRLNRDWYDVNEIVEMSLAGTEGSRRVRETRVEVAEGLPLVKADLVLLAQATSNLIENAARHSVSWSSIDVGAARDNGRFVLTVADHGPGIPFDQRDRVFNQFVRSPGSGMAEGSVGLGLAIALGIVRAHGGTLTLRDTPGGGSTFVMELPQPADAPASSPVSESRA